MAVPPSHAVSDALRAVERLQKIVHATRMSMGISRDLMKQATDLRRDLGPDADLGSLKPFVDRLEGVHFELFLDEVDDSSYLLGLATVRLWTAFESGTDDTVRAALQVDDAWSTAPALKDCKLTLAELQLPAEEKVEILLDQYLNTTKVLKQPGAGRLEGVLKAAGLDGGVDADIRRNILEIAETRHVLVHRDGRPDEKFELRCPWVPRYGGGILRVTTGDFHRFTMTAFAYLGEIMARLQEKGLFVSNDGWRANADQAATKIRELAANPLQPPPGSIQAWWNDALRWKDGVAPPNPFGPGTDARG